MTEEQLRFAEEVANVLHRKMAPAEAEQDQRLRAITAALDRLALPRPSAALPAAPDTSLEARFASLEARLTALESALGTASEDAS